MQLKPAAAHTASAIAAPAVAIDAVQASGQPLDAPTRDFMETRFGVDFSRVRIHAGDVAARAAHEVRARAYAMGHHVVFGAGEFAPATVEGRRLIAHELAHVVQQTAPGGSPALQRDPKDKDPKAAPPPAPASQDVAVVLSKDAGLMTEAMVLAPGATILQASSLDELAAQFKTI